MTDCGVTVVIPTRDRPDEVRRAVSAAAGQQGVSVDVIVVDDGSRVPVAFPRQDDVRVPRQDDVRVRVIRVEPSAGVSAARNRGIAAALHGWIAFLDDDDIWAPKLLGRLLEVAEATGASVVKSATVRLDLNGRALTLSNPNPADTVAVRPLPEKLRSFNALGGPSGVMVRRELLDRVGGFDEELSVLADWELWLRLSAAGVVATCPEPLTGYVVHSGSMSVRNVERAEQDFRVMARRYGLASQRGDPGLYDGDFMRWLGFMCRSSGHRLRASALFWQTWRRSGYWRDLARVVSAPLGTRLADWLYEVELRISSRSGSPAAPEWVSRYQDRPGAPLRPMARVTGRGSDSAIAQQASREPAG